ncbi:hypothetical protein ACTOB_006268 [Actinoplanes oblitus]|uniref:DUF397 domain-containing protein n=1 Tax=Actinoplanes oblitus TaxID=3040509 RepID=A0ABY8W8Q4_9ACTN|nr:hypothetical protein [Actinoplanes oblitus]WIM94254.1 hypothetical protein ACTOB_006268 [Actinoplanes oblitus]
MNNASCESGKQAPLSLQVVANRCSAGSCPTIYRTDSGRYVVQGFTVSAERAGIDLPEGEMLVEIPAELLREVLGSLS